MSDHLVLQRKNVGELSIVLLGPDLLGVFRLHQIGVDPETVAGLPHASVEHVAHAEIAPDLLRLRRLAGIALNRACGRSRTVPTVPKAASSGPRSARRRNIAAPPRSTCWRREAPRSMVCPSGPMPGRPGSREWLEAGSTRSKATHRQRRARPPPVRNRRSEPKPTARLRGRGFALAFAGAAPSRTIL